MLCVSLHPIDIYTFRFCRDFACRRMLKSSPEPNDKYGIESAYARLVKFISNSVDKNLNILDFSFNTLTDLPNCVTTLANLQILDLRSNFLQKIPECVQKLLNLQHLLLAGNLIEDLNGVSLKRALKLKRLDLSYNLILSLTFNFWPLKSLEYLDLSHNSITLVPKSFAPQHNLKTLLLSHNKINKIPQALAMLSNLEILDLSSNNIFSLPHGLFELMHSLRRLLLNQNPLTDIPELSDLISLELLDLSETAITKIPVSIAKLSQLNSLYLDDPVDDYQTIFNVLDRRVSGRFTKFTKDDQLLCEQSLPLIIKELKKRV